MQDSLTQTFAVFKVIFLSYFCSFFFPASSSFIHLLSVTGKHNGFITQCLQHRGILFSLLEPRWSSLCDSRDNTPTRRPLHSNGLDITEQGVMRTFTLVLTIVFYDMMRLSFHLECRWLKSRLPFLMLTRFSFSMQVKADQPTQASSVKGISTQK